MLFGATNHECVVTVILDQSWPNPIITWPYNVVKYMNTIKYISKWAKIACSIEGPAAGLYFNVMRLRFRTMWYCNLHIPLWGTITTTTNYEVITWKHFRIVVPLWGNPLIIYGFLPYIANNVKPVCFQVVILNNSLDKKSSCRWLMLKWRLWNAKIHGHIFVSRPHGQSMGCFLV